MLQLDQKTLLETFSDVLNYSLKEIGEIEDPLTREALFLEYEKAYHNLEKDDSLQDYLSYGNPLMEAFYRKEEAEIPYRSKGILFEYGDQVHCYPMVWNRTNHSSHALSCGFCGTPIEVGKRYGLLRLMLYHLDSKKTYVIKPLPFNLDCGHSLPVTISELEDLKEGMERDDFNSRNFSLNRSYQNQNLIYLDECSANLGSIELEPIAWNAIHLPFLVRMKRRLDVDYHHYVVLHESISKISSYQFLSPRTIRKDLFERMPYYRMDYPEEILEEHKRRIGKGKVYVRR